VTLASLICVELIVLQLSMWNCNTGTLRQRGMQNSQECIWNT